MNVLLMLGRKPMEMGDKVTRDRIMERYHQEFPEFGFHRNKGYPTKEHRQALLKYGYCPIHRRTFKGVREVVEGFGILFASPRGKHAGSSLPGGESPIV